MKRSHAVFVLAAAMLIGCSDAEKSTAPSFIPATSTPTSSVTLRGTVILNPNQAINPMFDLRLDDGTLIGLAGADALALNSVVGANIEVVGLEIGDSTVEVQQFLVTAVGGRDVADGILERTESGTYALRLTSGGTLDIANPSDDLIAHVGERIWMAADDGGAAQSFGVIQVST